MSQGLYIFTLTLFTYTSECVTVGQIIQLTHRRRERKSLAKVFLSFQLLMSWHGKVYTVSFRLPHARKPLPRLHDNLQLLCLLCYQTTLLVCSLFQSVSLSLFSLLCLIRSVFREKIWQSIRRVEGRERGELCRYDAYRQSQQFINSFIQSLRLTYGMVWSNT